MLKLPDWEVRLTAHGPTNERLVGVWTKSDVCKSGSSCERLADRINAPWIALHIESATAAQWIDADRQQLHRNLKLAESWAAKSFKLPVMMLSRATCICIESQRYKDRRRKDRQADHAWWRSPNSLVDRLLQESRNMDIVVVHGVDAPHPDSGVWTTHPFRLSPARWLKQPVFACINISRTVDESRRLLRGQFSHGLSIRRGC